MFKPLPSPEQTSSSEQSKKISIGQKVALTIIFAAILMISATLLRFFNVFALYESAAYIILISSPLGILLYHQTKDRITAALQNSPKYNGIILFSALYCVVVVVMALSYNVYMDSSLPDKKPFTIIDKHIQSNKGSKSYYVEIQRPDFVQPPFSFSSTESIRISKAEYDRLTPGLTSISLSVHMGALDIPWYNDYAISGLSAAPITPPAQSYTRNTDSDVNSACLWKSTFDANTEIEKIMPDDTFRDFWGNKQPRSVEPLVRGQRHGIAHYTFANGATYADIPWNHGQKHGVFTLYRDDGTREQTLSYKNGSPYGIQEWYDSNGTLSKSYLYTGDGKTQNPSICASRQH